MLVIVQSRGQSNVVRQSQQGNHLNARKVALACADAILAEAEVSC